MNTNYSAFPTLGFALTEPGFAEVKQYVTNVVPHFALAVVGFAAH